MAVQSNYSITQIDEAIRKRLFSYIYSAYANAPTTGISLTGGTDNIVALTNLTTTDISGFDAYTTLDGPALRYIGSGLGNGDSTNFRMEFHAAFESTTGAANFVIKTKKRPYTESDFGNATTIEGAGISLDIANNTESVVTVVAPTFTLNDGDLLEISVNPNTSQTINVNAYAIKIIEL